MRYQCRRRPAAAVLLAALSISLGACGGSSPVDQPAPSASVPGSSAASTRCTALAALQLPDTTIESARLDRGGVVLKYLQAGSMPENCVVTGTIGAYTSAHTNPDTGSNAYGTRFELRLPSNWNGRFFFQGGGAADGYLAPAHGPIPGQTATLTGNSAQTPALWRGYAVVSTDGGHDSGSTQAASLKAGFGVDPMARINYGYGAIGQVTPVAKQVIQQYYASAPAYSYFLGCSKGGQEAMQALQKYGDQFDGIVAGDPGFRLPHAAVAEAWTTQALAEVVLTDHPGAVDSKGHALLYRAFSNADLELIRKSVLERCDTLDGLADGMIFQAQACLGQFEPASLQCTGRKTSSCLSAAQVQGLHTIFAGAQRRDGSAIYAAFPYDTGMNGSNGWGMWNLGALPLGFNTALNATLAQQSSAYVFSTPPNPDLDVFSVNIDSFAQSITATSGDYRTSAIGFMAATSTDLQKFRAHDGKVIFFHGGSDPVFSPLDTIDYYQSLSKTYGGSTRDFARLYLVPGMNHCFGGDYTADYFDTLDAISNWVENGEAPERIIAKPSTASSRLPKQLTRPLCPYPQYAKYEGSGAVNDAASFSCAAP